MLDLGASLTTITKTTQIDRNTVKFAAKAGASATARDALDAGELDVEQAAIIGAFEAEGDHDAVARLLDAGAYRFRHVAHAITNERREARARAEAAAPWIARGHHPRRPAANLAAGLPVAGRGGTANPRRGDVTPR